MVEVTFVSGENLTKKKIPEKIWDDFMNQLLDFWSLSEDGEIGYKYKGKNIVKIAWHYAHAYL